MYNKWKDVSTDEKNLHRTEADACVKDLIQYIKKYFINRLIQIGTIKHVMGLIFTGDAIIITNSGDGLNYHKFEISTISEHIN